MRRKLGDRRIRPRYDIVGDLWGTLETVLRLPLRNVGLGGALIESHVPLQAESVHRLAFVSDGRETAAQVRIRYVQPTISADGERTYLIGIEFLSIEPAMAALITRWMSSGQDEAASAAEA